MKMTFSVLAKTGRMCNARRRRESMVGKLHAARLVVVVVGWKLKLGAYSSGDVPGYLTR